MDTGRTALKIKEALLVKGARSVKLVALLDKAERRTCDIRPDYCCFKVILHLTQDIVSKQIDAEGLSRFHPYLPFIGLY